MAHELYHAVQHLAQEQAGDGQASDFQATLYSRLPRGKSKDCYATRSIFNALLAEGTATYVGDPALLPETGTYAVAERERRAGIKGDLKTERTLLDMSLAAVTGAEPDAVEDVYAIGFYNPAPLYALGYVMAKAIGEHDGDVELAQLISQPGDAFARRYIDLTADPQLNLPRLGPYAKLWASRVGCAAR